MSIACSGLTKVVTVTLLLTTEPASSTFVEGSDVNVIKMKAEKFLYRSIGSKRNENGSVLLRISISKPKDSDLV
jgi:hypothetical protein